MRKYDDDAVHGPKYNWRRTSWNNIAARIKNKKQAVCMYLPAKNDLDRKVAIQKGFRPENLIAVERDRQTAKELSAKGVPVICADIYDAARSWGGVDVVFADHFGGVDGGVVSFLYDYCFSAAAPTGLGVFAVNMRRGQDKGALLREEILDLYPDAYHLLMEKQSHSNLTHRGLLLLALHAHFVYEEINKIDASNCEKMNMYEQAIELSRPSVLTYKNASGVDYDTLIVSSFVGLSVKGDFASEKRGRKAMRSKVKKEVASKVAAQKAVTTMRKRGLISAAAR